MQNVILALLVLLLVLQAFYLLVLQLVYPLNTGILSAYGMLAESLNARSLPLSGELNDPQELQGLYPSSVTLLSGGGDRVAFFSGAAAGAADAVVALAAGMLEQAQPQTDEGTLGFSQLLQQDGLLLDLGRELPLDIALALSLHSGGPKLPARRLLLTQSGSGLLLSFDGGEDRLYRSEDRDLLTRYRDCVEALGEPGLTEPIAVAGRGPAEALLPHGALSASGAQTAFYAIHAYNLFESASGNVWRAVREAFSFSAGMRENIEADGSVRYVENNSSLTLWPDGQVSYRATGARYGVSVQELLQTELDSITAVEVIRAGYALYEACLPLEYSSDVGLRYTGAQWQEGRLTLYYDYAVRGLPVFLEGQAHAMTLQYDSGFFTGAQLLLRGYDMGERVYLSSAGPIVALAQRRYEGAAILFEPAYRDDGREGVLQPSYRLTRGGDAHAVD